MQTRNSYLRLTRAIRTKQLHEARELFKDIMTQKVASRLAEERKHLMEDKYHTCPECEANFPDKSLQDGKLPAHKFNGKPCPGAGQQPSKD